MKLHEKLQGCCNDSVPVAALIIGNQAAMSERFRQFADWEKFEASFGR
jgi:hypothetical protein